MSFFQKKCITISVALVLAASLAYAAESREPAQDKSPVEIGGYVATDYYSDLGDMSSPTLEIGEVNLDAIVNVSEEVVASVQIKTWNKLDSMWIDQAFVSYKPQSLSMEFLFGQQTFNYGLLSTRMISSPLLYESVDIRKPGLTLLGTMDQLTAGCAVFVLDNTDPSTMVDSRWYASVINIDLMLPGESMARLSSFVQTDKVTLDLAGTAQFSNFVFDAEVLATLQSDDSTKTSGLYAGLLWNVNDRLGIAIRSDGLSFDNFREMETRFAGGVVLEIKDGMYCAIELSHSLPPVGDASNEIAIQFGLEQKINLPGFQRKTLKQE